MAIEWTPWFNVPCHRRLEVLGVTFFLLMVLLAPICTFLIIYLLKFVNCPTRIWRTQCVRTIAVRYCDWHPRVHIAFTNFSSIAGNIYWQIICAAYVIFYIFDIKSGDRGGRGVGSTWVRGWCIWKHAINYFPIDLVKTVDLPPDRNYLICIFPHGLVGFGAGGNFGTSHSKWSTLFPGIRPKLATLRINSLVPVARELMLSFGTCWASVNALTKLLTQSNDPNDKSNRDGYTANAVGLVVGGEREQRYIYPDTYRFFVKTRKGFVRVALKTGGTLVPAISFGENNYYDVTERRSTYKTYKMPPFGWGRGFLQYNYGIIPRRTPITTVIGAPIEVDKIPNPSEEEVDRVHETFCRQLRELFDKHKSNYVKNYEDVELEIF